ncbi:hypothetical protein RSOLAG22IIIB_12511 [Rhizoctonia solani]|uniref:Aminoglycoside phosphotransferase domain-containing protein n=1 Tax=Rhizoctonia solani TaxID=456999 RepID=A0A0K6GEZ0_9AGAM|nr:hypothetical protein RSOLAG22IIIB_12511 [Rhizoctonia solani]
MLFKMDTIALAVETTSPTWLPTPHELILKCKEHGFSPNAFRISSPCGSQHAFIKFGSSVAMGEALTQNYVANIVNADEDAVVLIPRVYLAFQYKGAGYIAMEYIPGNDCSQDDVDAIAVAVKRLGSVDSPTRSPGPVGGGMITHRFFYDHQSDIQYNSLQDLQEHINNILTKAKYECSVDFNDEDGGSLRLCLDDIHPGNFRKDPSGRLFALDFGKNNFLPFAFQGLAFVEGHALASEVGTVLGSKSKYQWTLMLAAGRLNLYGNSSHGLPRHLRQ